MHILTLRSIIHIDSVCKIKPQSHTETIYFQMKSNSLNFDTISWVKSTNDAAAKEFISCPEVTGGAAEGFIYISPKSPILARLLIKHGVFIRGEVAETYIVQVFSLPRAHAY